MKQALATMALAGAFAALAALPPAGPSMAQEAGEGMIYGRHLMTSEEIEEFRERMRSAASAEERQQIREEHHQEMQERARSQGLTLPEMPPQGQGMGPGQGMGQGMGEGMEPGQGMGQGQGMGSGHMMEPGRGMEPGRMRGRGGGR